MEKLMAKGIDTPINCFTAFDDVKSRERARKLGSRGFFDKTGG